MSFGAGASDAGLRDNDLNINGTEIHLPSMLMVTPRLLQSVKEAFNGGRRITSRWMGTGCPDRPVSYDFQLAWEFSQDYAEDIEFLEQLRVTPGPHTFTYWKKIIALWTVTAGQTVFWLPWPDAFGKDYPNKTFDQYKAIVRVNNGAAEVVEYQPVVTEATVVDPGKVWISKTPAEHPDNGSLMAIMKFGTGPAAASRITAEYHPLFNVDVVDLQTSPFAGDQPFREDKTLQFVTVN